ncbi:MAG: AAA family ATPase [Verrucomicrobiota bacterium]
MSLTPEEIQKEVEETATWVPTLRDKIREVIVGQEYMIDRLIVGLLANGHVLLEGVPGLAKTLSVRTLATAIRADFSRIQFTPDLLPADVIGTLIYNPQTSEFQTRKGPIFANVVLADEINRAPAKVQSALLEAMQERQVTLGDETHHLPAPFLVLATENPIDQEGTYPLPEAQVDRFMLKLKVDYPEKKEELRILQEMATTKPNTTVDPVIGLEEILRARETVDKIYVDPKLQQYVVDLVFATRKPSEYGLDMDHFIQFGGSPRATISLVLAAKAWAFLQGRGYVTPHDIKTIGMDVLRHRIIPSYEAEAEGYSSEPIISRVFDTIAVP